MPVPFSDEHKAALKQAVECLNETMAGIIRDCGESISIRPWANFSADDGVAYIEVEVTTGRFRA